MSDYIQLGNLDVYKMAVELSRDAWRIYERLDWRDKKILGDQFIESTDSVGANIAEGYGRYHYKDRLIFFYDSRGSLGEIQSQLTDALDLKFIDKAKYSELIDQTEKISRILGGLIHQTQSLSAKKS